MDIAGDGSLVRQTIELEPLLQDAFSSPFKSVNSKLGLPALPTIEVCAGPGAVEYSLVVEKLF